mgnify:FL=1|tara:strand:+ start:1753 stop:1974 length:222 start_codon:yes stop_codon:yes gene_type:complete
MDLEQQIKKAIYEHVSKFNLSKVELQEVDTYVLSMLNDFKNIINSQNSILSDKKKLNELKKVILESLGESKIV